jgi:uncharacterized protein YcbK (DUF882 family)
MQPKLEIDLEANIDGSKYFKWKEALWLPQVSAYAVPSKLQQSHIVSQAKALDKIREYFGYAIVVHSWLRPEKYNAMIGGATRSAHVLGSATDFHVVSVSCDEVKRVLQANPDLYLGRGEIDTTNWVHLDLRPGPWFRVRKEPGT